jgi:alpha-tubulin suppressor-like RCC1 family protein
MSRMHSLWRVGRTPVCVALGASALVGAHAAPIAHNETEVFSWGGSTFGETGHGHESTGVGVATRIDGLRNRHVIAVSAAGSGVSSAALTSDGTVFTWGCGRDARLGRGEGGGQNQLLPRQIENLPQDDPITVVSLGEYHGALLSASGKLYTFGKRAQGHGNPKSVQPTLVTSLSTVKIVGVCCGREHTVAIDSDGVAYGWGPNVSHALGTGTKDEVKVPVVIPGLAGMVWQPFCGHQQIGRSEPLNRKPLTTRH